MQSLITIIRWLIMSITLFLITILAFNALTYINFNSCYGFLKLKQGPIETGWYLPAYYAHVLAAGAILLIGFYQLQTKYSLKNKSIHRFLGKLYGYGILIFAAPGGLVMSFFIDRGWSVLTSFVLQSIFWFVFTFLAVKNIREGKVEQHRRWMWRSYALTFAAVALRLYVFLFTSSFNLATPEAYSTIAWASWVINLLLVELFLQISPKSKIS